MCKFIIFKEDYADLLDEIKDLPDDEKKEKINDFKKNWKEIYVSLLF